MDYKDTLNLPKTPFPMRGNLPVREKDMLARWQEIDLYRKMTGARKDSPTFILHDGPPYANGNIHLGTALNKIIKDIVIKAKNMTGFDGVFVPQNYTIDQYRKESDLYMNDTSEHAFDRFSFDIDDSDTLTCMATTAPTLLQPRLEIWKPLG